MIPRRSSYAKASRHERYHCLPGLSREPGCGPGVHQPQYKEDKVACLVNLRSEVHEQDPQPQPPESFLLPRRVQRLVRRMKGQAGELPAEEMPAEEALHWTFARSD